MGIKQYYNSSCTVDNWYEKYVSVAAKNSGSMFKFFNTNFRGLASINNAVVQFSSCEGIKRSEWEHVAKTGQEKWKHYVVRMLQARLFSKNVDHYYKSQKGKSYQKMLDGDFSDTEKWLLTLLFILDGYFNDTPNYFPVTSKAVCSNFLAAGYTEEDISAIIKDFILHFNSNQKLDVSDVFRFEYTYLDSFYDEPDFLSILRNSTNIQKQELYDYVTEKYKNKEYKTKKNACLISYKFKPGGVYTKETLLNNATILYLTDAINNNIHASFKDFIIAILKRYNEINHIDSGKVFSFILSEKDIFKVIFYNVCGVELEDNPDIVAEIDSSTDVADTSIDPTDMKSLGNLRRISTALKKRAKEESHYKCALETLEHCRYFTSKETGENYLEIHHLIPREFGNDFDNTIEILPNYVPLCPHCHRMIHLAVDKERNTIISYLFNQRENALEAKGLEIDWEKLKKYYGIKGLW